jgi:hypothetical protein
VQRIGRIDLAAPRPGWLGAGAIRLGVLCLFVVLVELLRPRLTPYEAGWLVLAGGLVMVVGALLFLARARRVAVRLPIPDRARRVTDATFLLLRQLGLPILGLAFFLFWTFVYLGLWWFRPEDSFVGIGDAGSPRFSDFFYYAVMVALTSPPEGIVPISRGARSATMIEILTGLALLTTYVSSLFELRRQRAAEPQSDPEP